MEDRNLKEVFFLNYPVVRRGQEALSQVACAYICSIAPSLEEAANQADQYFLRTGWVAGELISWRPAVHADLPEMDRTELSLLTRARLETPRVYALIIEGGESQAPPVVGSLH